MRSRAQSNEVPRFQKRGAAIAFASAAPRLERRLVFLDGLRGISSLRCWNNALSRHINLRKAQVLDRRDSLRNPAGLTYGRAHRIRDAA